MASCCVLPLRCGGSGVYNLRSFAWGVDGACDTAMLNMAASCFIYTDCFSSICRMGLDGAWFLRDSVSSSSVLVTSSAAERLRNLFCTRKSSAMSYNRSDDVLGMNDVRRI